MNWSPNQITFMIDGVGYYTYNPNTKDAATWPFDLDQFLILNVAMGGFAGTPDTNFTESAMIIDYVRVYQNSTASTDDFFSSQFSVYPNPTSNFITIKTKNAIDKIEIHSTIGQLVFIQKNHFNQLNVSDLNPGLYLMKIYANNKTATKKIIISDK